MARAKRGARYLSFAEGVGRSDVAPTHPYHYIYISCNSGTQTAIYVIRTAYPLIRMNVANSRFSIWSGLTQNVEHPFRAVLKRAFLLSNRKLQLPASGLDLHQRQSVLFHHGFHTGHNIGDLVVHHVFPRMECGAGPSHDRYI